MRNVLFIFVMISSLFYAQDKPITWKKNVKDLGGGSYELILTADLEKGWHLYSPENTNEFIIPTTVQFLENPNIEWQGAMKTIGEKETIYSKAFSDDLIEYVSDVTYSRKFKAKNSKALTIVAEVEYQICNEKTCLAPENLEFDFEVSPKVTTVKNDAPKIEEKDSQLESDTKPKVPNELEESKASVQEENDVSEKTSDSIQQNITTNNNSAEKNMKGKEENLIISSIDVDNPLYKDCGEAKDENKSYLLLFALGFLGGIIALVTPCVYPMIPLTISFFTKGSGEHKGKGNALMYAFFIFAIFVLISLPFHLFNINSDIFNQISTSVWLNLFFFFTFVFFAFSFFGYYELTLPQKWMNRTDKLSNSGGLIGVFFMALTLVIVSFSCTGPILGGLLGTISGADGPNKLTSAFAGFGVSWALIFGLLALFPSMLKNMPKSGGWLNTTKVVLGFIELALALKFLSKADLVSKTFWLKRELFVLIWIVIAILTILYFLGFIRFPHDERPNKMSWSKRIGAMLFLAFALYLVPGLFPNHHKPNLKLLSGLTPPMSVSYFADEEGECPLGLNCTHDYYDALELAQKENKPILIDFTGWGCENCRKMEEFVWSQPDVLKILENDVILASLYVDEKEALKNPYTIELKDGSRRKIKSVGNQWSIFQKENFKEQTQPQYVLITPDQRVINYPVGGYMSKEDFLSFLNCGIDNFESHKN